mmetsp:Transcript_3106/g.5399  ORF Transcript_3106/g.5399 Transcript_3106/m.5399 type:complete len:210 (-) Transcript_3106:83-712(-)
MPVEGIVRLGGISADSPGVVSMWNWLSRIESGCDSIHHHLLSRFFSGLSEFHADGRPIGRLEIWRSQWSLIRCRDIWQDLVYACNSSNWPAKRLCSHWTASCSLYQERIWNDMRTKVRALLSQLRLPDFTPERGQSPRVMSRRREEQNGQQQLPQQQLLLRRQQLQLGQQQQQQLRRVLKWQQPPKASAVRRPVQGHRQGMRCGQPRKR